MNVKNYLNRLGIHRSESKHLYSSAVQLILLFLFLSLQYFSSLSSSHSLIPLHFRIKSMQRPLKQVNISDEHFFLWHISLSSEPSGQSTFDHIIIIYLYFNTIPLNDLYVFFYFIFLLFNNFIDL